MIRRTFIASLLALPSVLLAKWRGECLVVKNISNENLATGDIYFVWKQDEDGNVRWVTVDGFKVLEPCPPLSTPSAGAPSLRRYRNLEHATRRT